VSQVTAPTPGLLREEPVFFEAGGETLFGIHTRPTVDDRGTALVLLPSAERLGYHRDRVGFVLARRAAERGHHAFRLDYRGQGESTGKVGRFRLDEPFTVDALGAAALLRENGVPRAFFAGSCFGARTGIAAALEDPSTAGVILVSLPMTDYASGERGSRRTAQTPLPSLGKKALRRKTLRDLRDPDLRKVYGEAARFKLKSLTHRLETQTDEDRLSPHLFGALERLVDRHVPLLFLYGEHDGALAEFLTVRDVELRELLERAGETIEVSVVPGRLHGWVSIPTTQAATDRMLDWVGRIDRRTRMS